MYPQIEWSNSLLGRLKQAARVGSDAALAKALGTSKQNLNGHKARGVFPEKLLRRAADRFGVDYEWLAHGKGAPAESRTTETPPRAYREREVLEVITEGSPLYMRPDVLEILREVETVYASEDADAMKTLRACLDGALAIVKAHTVTGGPRGEKKKSRTA